MAPVPMEITQQSLGHCIKADDEPTDLGQGLSKTRAKGRLYRDFIVVESHQPTNIE